MIKILTSKQHKDLIDKVVKAGFESKKQEMVATNRQKTIKELEMRASTYERILEKELEYSRNLLSKQRELIVSNEEQKEQLQTHLKHQSVLESKITALERVVDFNDSEINRLKEHIDQTKYNDQQMMYEYTTQIEELNKQVDYLKTTLKNNLIIFEYQDHIKKPWFKYTNRGVEFNAFPYQQYLEATKYAIEQKLQEVTNDDESEPTR